MLSGSPQLYFPIARLLGNGQLISDQTELVIEGFPRSANSFVEAAFKVAHRENELCIASHTHAAAQVIEATRRRLPSLVLYRQPDDAVASLLEMLPDYRSAATLYEDYAAFYNRVQPVLEDIELASFDLAVHDVSEVIHRVNHRFGTPFQVSQPWRTFLNEVELARDEISRHRVGRAPRYSRAYSEELRSSRKARRDSIRQMLDALAENRSRKRACAAYGAMRRADSMRNQKPVIIHSA